MNKIRNISILLRTIFQLAFIALPILLIVSWMHAPDQLVLLGGVFQLDAIPRSYSGLHIYSSNGVPEKVIMYSFTLGQKIIGCLISFVPTLIQMFILYCLVKLFRLYEQGEIFSLNNVKYVRNIGYALLLGQVMEPIYQFVMGVFITYYNPPKHHFASITFDQNNLGILITALLVILISWIMAEGYSLREEQQFTV